MPTDNQQDKSKTGRGELAPPKGNLGIMIPGYGSGGDDVRCRSRSRAQGNFGAHWLGDANGTHSAGQAHRWPVAQGEGFCAAGRTERLGFHRMGHLRRRHVCGCRQGWRAGSLAAGAGEAVPVIDQAAQGGVRQELREEARRPECEEGQEQEGTGRAGARRHSRLQEVERRGPAGDDLVRIDRDVYRSRARCTRPWTRSRRACWRTTRTLRRR